MARTITSGDISAIALTQSMFEETTVWICVAGEWIDLISLDAGRVACIKIADYQTMQKAYDKQSTAPFDPPEF